jgi:hypothetical protein
MYHCLTDDAGSSVKLFTHKLSEVSYDNAEAQVGIGPQWIWLADDDIAEGIQRISGRRV